MTALAEVPAGVGVERFEPALPLEAVFESPKNPRQHYDSAALKELADNLAAVGQITPIVVRPRPEGGYELAAGHRRARAARLAGLTALAALVRELDDARFAEILNVENLQRDDLNALEEAAGFRTLMTDAGYDVPRIAERVGRSVKYVYDRLKLLQLIPEAKKLLEAGTITAGHGILLARLTKEEQKRALAFDDGTDFRLRDGGVFEPERIDETHFPGAAPELELGDARKARSVRELQQWIDDNIRFDPAKVDQADLAFDLPKTAELLDSAASNKLKVIKITREYRVPDAARDEKERTYGSQSWKRADGQADPFPSWDGRKKKAEPSKTCEHARIGLVVAGPGRGEAFLVCVNKEKCSVHWAQEMKERARRAKEREQYAANDGAPKASRSSDAKRQAEAEAERRKWERDRAIEDAVETQTRAAVLSKVTGNLPPAVLAEVVLALSNDLTADDLKALAGLLGVKTVSAWGPDRQKFRKALLAAKTDALAKAVVLVTMVHEQYGYGSADESALGPVAAAYGVDPKVIEKAVRAEFDRKDAEEAAKRKVEAEAKAAAAKKPKPVQTSATTKGKKRAGDVARARKAKRGAKT